VQPKVVNRLSEDQLKDGAEIEICISNTWYVAVVVRQQNNRLTYRLEEEAVRIDRKASFGKPPKEILPPGYEGEIIPRLGVNVRQRIGGFSKAA
jgi:hypothetical protein